MKSIKKRAFLVSIPLLAIFIASLLWIFSEPIKKTENARLLATITRSGKVLDTIVLDEVLEAYTLSFFTEEGHYNEVLVSPGAIQITQADCPNQQCVHQGRRSRPGIPITCLPHQLIIVLQYEAMNEDAIIY